MIELTSSRGKRSDIDARLLEIQAKILLSKAYQNMPAGHGRFDFKKMYYNFKPEIKLKIKSV